MNRREFLQCAAILVSGAGASQLGFTLTQEQQTYLATAPNYNSTPGNYLTGAQRKIVAAMAEVIIPRTDTPGAIDAGVPTFIELMASDWFNDQEKATFAAGMKDLETRIPKEYGKTFDQLSAEEQLGIMEAMEDAASDSPWYEFGNVMRQFISDAPFICQIKELTVWGFFTSEVGATQVLRYNPMPMHFDGDIALSLQDSTWATPL
jgi:gluconate 2-dehydrogenase gamma chain